MEFQSRNCQSISPPTFSFTSLLTCVFPTPSHHCHSYSNTATVIPTVNSRSITKAMVSLICYIGMVLLIVSVAATKQQNMTLVQQQQKIMMMDTIIKVKQRQQSEFFPEITGSPLLMVVDQSDTLETQGYESVGSVEVFRTIQNAIDAVPNGNKQWVFIQVGPGIYREKITIPCMKSFIVLQGAGRDLTIIAWDDTANIMGTASSATFSSFASNFVAKYITFKNEAPAPPPGAEKKQAVAALIAGDMSSFYSCGFYGAQDTLFDYEGRHYYRDCFIEGSIDFIFGHAQSIFKGCELHTIAQSIGSLTAHNRWNPLENSGFVFTGCSVTGSGNVYLGRAWGAYSRVIFLMTYMDDIISPEGWYDWGVPARRQTVYYGQYKCFGRGANEDLRVKWSHELSDEEARPFLEVSFINGVEWLHEI